MGNFVIFVANWLRGWRIDLDGWLVRARCEDDPDLADRPDVGFSEEACLAVRTQRQAFALDRGRFRP